MSNPTPPKRRRGIFLLPNLFTTATLFAGFYAIVSAIGGDYQAGAIAIFVAGVMDGLDGRVARMTNTQSDFGKEYDSMADVVSFGLAPALVVYLWSLSTMGQYGWYWAQIGWLASFVFAAGAALRLARFNTQVGIQDKRFFRGLPSPAAAAVIAGFVWICTDSSVAGDSVTIPALSLTLAAGGLMVSNLHYYSFKDIKLNERVPFAYVLIIVGGFILIALNPPAILFLGFFCYLLSGVLLGWRRHRRYRARRSEHADD
ncbi:MAG: CDP-diacylglycerol--serine O-phosphatidyltransferase [Pseudomonadota bacterium]|nr:CDP-diacylglycerol--serine O-phosphatidyltransferase [Pseudomonadota bacterium]